MKLYRIWSNMRVIGEADSLPKAISICRHAARTDATASIRITHGYREDIKVVSPVAQLENIQLWADRELPKYIKLDSSGRVRTATVEEAAAVGFPTV